MSMSLPEPTRKSTGLPDERLVLNYRWLEVHLDTAMLHARFAPENMPTPSRGGSHP